jgi:prevent-host-death family protein
VHPPLEKWLSSGYFAKMGKYSVAEARNNLSGLIDRALKGEGVVITRHGRSVVELKPISPIAEPITPEALDWLTQRRVGRRMPREDAAVSVRKIRGEWAR